MKHSTKKRRRKEENKARRKRGGSKKGKPLKFNFETIKKMTTDWKHFFSQKNDEGKS